MNRQNQPLLASSLQTSYNLGVLPELVRSLVADLTDAVEERIRQAFDLAALSRDAGVKGTSFYFTDSHHSDSGCI